MTRFLHGWVIALALGLAPASFAQPAPAPMPPIPAGTCDVPTMPANGPHVSLPQVAAALSNGGPLDILAIGSGTMANPRLHPDEAFPARTAQVLRDARPGLDAHVTVEARRGQSAADMLTALRRALAAHPYRLVLWQTGSVEELRGTAPAELERTLDRGADATRDAGADLVLIDPQYATELATVADPAAYRAAFAHTATRPGVALLSRYALMQDWAKTGQLDLEHVKVKDRHRTLALLHACIARALGAAILDGTHAVGPVP